MSENARGWAYAVVFFTMLLVTVTVVGAVYLVPALDGSVDCPWSGPCLIMSGAFVFLFFIFALAIVPIMYSIVVWTRRDDNDNDQEP